MSIQLTQENPTTPAPGIGDQIKEYLAAIGQRGGRVKGKKGFAAMPKRQARAIRKLSADSRRKAAQEAAAAAGKVA